MGTDLGGTNLMGRKQKIKSCSEQFPYLIFLSWTSPFCVMLLWKQTPRKYGHFLLRALGGASY